MADIFISYSRKDSDLALKLMEHFRAEGIEVWIDQHGIHGAEHWGAEIVDGISACSTFIVLLSSHSIESENVLRELSLASEKNKRVLPVVVESVLLPSAFEYPLAGLQRVEIANFDAILQAHKYGLERIIQKDRRKTLMILPFEDLSPTADNEWFSDGIVSEMISSLSHVKALHLMNAQTTKEFKSYKGHLLDYAKEMNIRYFVQGDVRKFGDQIKVSSRLLDIQTGDYIWQDSLKGKMDDIFDIQETVAKKVVEGLNIILTTREKKKVENKKTDNAAAYELFLKGNEFYYRRTRADYEKAMQFFDEAAQLDPEFAVAHLNIANTALEYYRTYSRDNEWILKATTHIERAALVFGESEDILSIRSILVRMLGNKDEALNLALQAVKRDPENVNSIDSLAWSYMSLGRISEAADTWKVAVQIEHNDRNNYFSYLIALNTLGDKARLAEAARDAIPLYQRYLKLTPNDLHTRVQYASILSMAQEHEAALSEARALELIDELDGIALFNLACLYNEEQEYERSIVTLLKAIDKGFRSIEHINDFLSGNETILKEFPAYDQVKQKMETINQQVK